MPWLLLKLHFTNEVILSQSSSRLGLVTGELANRKQAPGEHS